MFRYLYADRDRSTRDWALAVQEVVTKRRVDPRDDNETEFVDVDLVLGLYLQEYRKLSATIKEKLKEGYRKLEEKRGGEPGLRDLKGLVRSV